MLHFGIPNISVIQMPHSFLHLECIVITYLIKLTLNNIHCNGMYLELPLDSVKFGVYRLITEVNIRPKHHIVIYDIYID